MDSLTSLVPEARFVCLTGGSKSSQSLSAAEFASLDVTELTPVTSIPAWIGKRSIEGRWWFSGTSRHVAYASAWERDVLTFLDFSGDTISVARDPTVVLPSRLDRSPPMRPWLIVESPSHVRTLLLPRSESQRSRELASILSGHAINVALFALPSVEEMRVVRWLAGYRFTRFTLPPDVEREVRDACSADRSILETIQAAAHCLPHDESAIRANIYSQLWRRTITLGDPRAAISDMTKVVAA